MGDKVTKKADVVVTDHYTCWYFEEKYKTK